MRGPPIDYTEPATDLDEESDDSESLSLINFNTTRSRSRSGSYDDLITGEALGEQPAEEKAEEPESAELWGDQPLEWGPPKEKESEMGPALMAAAAFLLLAYMISS
jgi:hypothetical protein